MQNWNFNKRCFIENQNDHTFDLTYIIPYNIFLLLTIIVWNRISYQIHKFTFDYIMAYFDKNFQNSSVKNIFLHKDSTQWSIIDILFYWPCQLRAKSHKNFVLWFQIMIDHFVLLFHKMIDQLLPLPFGMSREFVTENSNTVNRATTMKVAF